MAVPTTSASLLKVLGEDPQSPRWTEFFNKYESTIRGFLLKCFREVDAEEVIQETLITLVKKLPLYEYDPDKKGHFRNYLIGIVRNKAYEQKKKNARAPSPYGSADDIAEAVEEDSQFTWEYEKQRFSVDLSDWRHEAYEAALTQFMANPKLSLRDKEIFHRTAVCGESPEVVAEAFGIKRNNVDQIKARMLAKLKELALQYANVCEDQGTGCKNPLPAGQ